MQKFDVPLAQATTSSLEALKAYSLDHRAHSEKDPGSGVGLKASGPSSLIRVHPWDTGGSGTITGLKAKVGRSERILHRAFRDSGDHFSELGAAGDHRQATIQALPENWIKGRRSIRSGLRTTRVITQLTATWVWCWLSKGGMKKAAQRSRRQGVLLAPQYVGLYDNLANYALAVQRFDEARQTIRQAQDPKIR